MIIPIILTLVASFLWAATNHIDKYLLANNNDTTSNVRTLLLFSSLVAGIVISPIWLIICKFHVTISLISFFALLIAALFYLIATYLYFKALEKNDASTVVIFFQLIPVFSYILTFIFFKEMLTIREIIGALIIIFSSVIISIDFEEQNTGNKKLASILMVLSSLFFALYFFAFDIAIRNSAYNSCAFWYQMGLLLIGLILFSFKENRKSFINNLKANAKKFVLLNLTNESINIVANLMVNFANLTIPLALANALNGFQGAFVFLIGVLGVIVLPKYITEDLRKKIVIQKILSILIGVIGLFILCY